MLNPSLSGLFSEYFPSLSASELATSYLCTPEAWWEGERQPPKLFFVFCDVLEQSHAGS